MTRASEQWLVANQVWRHSTVWTCYFVDLASARRYYRPYGIDARGVDDKLARREISLGKPDIPHGARLVVNDEGRYGITS